MMAYPQIRGYNNKEIVLKYIHYKLSQKRYDWVASRDRANLPPSTAGTFPTLVRLASLSSEVPSLVATNVAPDEEVSPVPQVVHAMLQRAGNEFSWRCRQDLARMSGQLHFTQDTARDCFVAVVEKLFQNGINWGKIIAFFEFGGMMCVQSVSLEISPLVNNIAIWMAEFLNGPLHDWIQNNGGWDAFVELYSNSMRPVTDFSWLLLKTILSLAVVGACITLGVYLRHK